jgi:hypothetical protein
MKMPMAYTSDALLALPDVRTSGLMWDMVPCKRQWHRCLSGLVAARNITMPAAPSMLASDALPVCW